MLGNYGVSWKIDIKNESLYDQKSSHTCIEFSKNQNFKLTLSIFKNLIVISHDVHKIVRKCFKLVFHRTHKRNLSFLY